MNCTRANELLVGYLYQELEDQEVGPFEAHLQGCAQCAHRLHSIRATIDVVHGLPQVEPPKSITNSLTKAASKALRDRRVSWFDRIRDSLRFLVVHPAMTAAVTLVVVVGISFYAYQRAPTPGSRPEMPLPEVAYQTGTETNAEPTNTPEATPGALESSVGRLSTELKNKKGDTTASIASTGARKQSKAADEETLGLRVKKPTTVERQAPMDNRRHVGTRGLWSQGQGRMAEDRDDNVPRKRARRVSPRRRPKPYPVAAQPQASPNPAPANDKSEETQGTQAARYKTLAEKAMTAGRCEDALRFYNHALSLGSSSSPVVVANVRRCAGVLGRNGEAELLKARKRYPLLAGHFEREIRRMRDDRGEAEASRKAVRKAKVKPAPAAVDAYSK